MRGLLRRASLVLDAFSVETRADSCERSIASVTAHPLVQAWAAATTSHVLLLDVDFVPFTNALSALQGPADRLVRDGKGSKRVYVVPAFERTGVGFRV